MAFARAAMSVGAAVLLAGLPGVPALAQTAAPSRGLVQITPVDTGKSVTLYSRSYGLVIGIDRYSNGWPRLSNGVKDAHAVADALEGQGFTVTRVMNPKARALRDAFEDFVFGPGADEQARLFIWFAGHGHTIKGEGYLVPSGAPGPESGARFRRQALSLRSFGRYMREIRAKHVLAVFDSCFAGTVFNTARSTPPPAITRATTLPVRQFVSSGEAEQEVSDDGTFRRLFIDALTGAAPRADANGDGYLTGSELGLYLADKVTNLTQEKQTPRWGKLRSVNLDRGDFVFQLRKPATVTGGTASTVPPGGGSAGGLGDARQAWKDAAGNAARLRRVIARYGDTIYADYARDDLTALEKAGDDLAAPPSEKPDPQAARSKADDGAFSVAKRRGTLDGYERYLRRFPDGKHVPIANERFSQLGKLETDFARLSATGTESKLRAFAGQNPVFTGRVEDVLAARKTAREKAEAEKKHPQKEARRRKQKNRGPAPVPSKSAPICILEEGIRLCRRY